jgi:hypothetical protein
MGAGENALVELFATIYAVGEGALILVDELELGLHLEAQRRLMECLKLAALERKIQILCTTHSAEVLGCVPPEARFFIDREGSTTRVLEGISPEYAAQKLSARPSSELDIFVEDEVSSRIIASVLRSELRVRLNIEVVGSATVVARQLASQYVRPKSKPCFALFDGDQLVKHSENRNHFVKMTERKDTSGEISRWFDEHALYMPGETWPENWLLQKADEKPSQLGDALGCSDERLREAVEFGRQAGKHSEFYEIGVQLGLAESHVLDRFALHAQSLFASDFETIIASMRKALDG